MAIRRTVIHDDHHLVAATDKGKVTSTAPSSPGMRKGEYLDMKDSWSWRTLARPPLKPARHSEDAAASATAFVLR